MSIEQEKIIDIIADNKNSTQVILLITDHLPWNESTEDHLFKLQEKINSYLSFVESGKLVQGQKRCQVPFQVYKWYKYIEGKIN